MAKENVIENAINETAVLGVKNMNIYEKLSAISLEITNVAKNLNVGVGQSSYKGVGEADVLAAVRPIEAKFRVYSYPIKRTVLDSTVIELKNYRGESRDSLFMRIEVTYRFVNMDKPEEYIDIISYGDGVDTQDKTPGKAMTYADKYALLKAYKIITGDDPDQNQSDQIVTPNKSSRANVAATSKTTAVKKGVSPAIAKECEELGIKLEQIAAKKGLKVEELTDEIVKPGLMILKKRKEAAQSIPETESQIVPSENK